MREQEALQHYCPEAESVYTGRKYGSDMKSQLLKLLAVFPAVFTATADTKRKEDSGMIKTTMKVDGMMCGMCEAHVCDAIRKAVPAARKVAASRSKKEASFLTEEAVDAARLKAAMSPWASIVPACVLARGEWNWQIPFLRPRDAGGYIWQKGHILCSMAKWCN